MKIMDLIKSYVRNTTLYYKWYNLNNPKIKMFAKFYSQLIPSGSMSFDVGANIGNRTESLSRVCSKVIAFEPLPFLVRKLENRFKYNKKIIIEPFAISDNAGMSEIYISQQHTMSSMSKEHITNIKKFWNNPPSFDEKMLVKTNTLDYFISKYGKPYFIKIDVEGYEKYVLKGLSTPIPLIAFEFNPTHIENTMECMDILCRLDPTYTFNLSPEESAELLFKEFLNVNTFLSHLKNNITNGKFGDIYAISNMKP